jgi:ATP-dependent Clp protease adaptor protein ClpS
MDIDDVDVIVQPKTIIEVKKPRRYSVVFHNDDITPQDFVIYILQEQFDKLYDEATRLMELVHSAGSAIVSVYTREIAEQKASDTMDQAKNFDFPLKVTAEIYDGDEEND